MQDLAGIFYKGTLTHTQDDCYTLAANAYARVMTTKVHTVDCSRVRTRIWMRGSTVYGIPLRGLRPVRTRLQSTVALAAHAQGGKTKNIINLLVCYQQNKVKFHIADTGWQNGHCVVINN